MSKALAGFVAVALLASSLGLASASVPKPKAVRKTVAITPSPTPSPSPTPAGYTEVPGGTVVHVALTNKISSSSAVVGDTFAVVATENVTIGGWIVIAKGAAGQGEVSTVVRAGGNGHAGSLGIQMDWIFATDGEKMHLTSQKNTQEGEGKQGASSTATVVSWALLGLPGLFAHNFVHGRDIDIDGTKTFDAYTQDTVHVVATSQATDAGFAH